MAERNNTNVPSTATSTAQSGSASSSDNITNVDIDALKAELAQAKADAAEATARADKAEADARAAAAASAATDAEVANQEAQNKRLLSEQRKVRIIIPSGRDLHERCPVPVAVNGREYLIVRDKEVDVPQSVINVLNDAVESVPVEDGDGPIKRVVFKNAQRFAFSVKGYINPETGELENL